MTPRLVLVLSEAKSGNVKVIEEYEGRVGQSCPGKARVALRTRSRVGNVTRHVLFHLHFYASLAYMYVVCILILNQFNNLLIFYLHKLNHQISLIRSIFHGILNIRLLLLIHIVLVLASNVISPELFLSLAKYLLTSCERCL